MRTGGILGLFDVEFYADKNDKESVKELILSLRTKGKTSKADRIRAEKILTYIRVLQEMRNPRRRALYEAYRGCPLGAAPLT